MENNTFQLNDNVSVNYGNITVYVPGPYDAVYLEDCRAASMTYGIISCLAILANTIAFTALASLKKKETGMLFLFSLVAADLMSPIIQLVLVSKDPACDQTYRDLFIKVNNNVTATMVITPCLQTSSFYAILLTMLGMAGDRLLATVKPFQHPQIITKRRLRVFICFLWLLSFVAGFLPFIIGFADIVSEKNSNVSDFREFIDIYLNNVYEGLSTSITICFVVACACFSFFLVVYGIIFREILRHHHFVLLTNQQSRGIVKGTITAFLIVITFAVCWLPFGITFITVFYSNQVSDTLPSANEYRSILQWRSTNFALVLLNSICDPVIYICRNKSVRYAFKNALMKLGCARICRCCQRQSAQMHSGRGSGVSDNIPLGSSLQSMSTQRTSLTTGTHLNIDQNTKLQKQDTSPC